MAGYLVYLHERIAGNPRRGLCTFTSLVLRRKLDTVERVFPYVATCGHEMDSVALPAGDVLVQYCLMVPNKTASGLLFPTQEDFQTCQVCHRDPCPNRRAPFDAAVWQALREA